MSREWWCKECREYFPIDTLHGHFRPDDKVKRKAQRAKKGQK